jgi:hypothetical protein
MNQAEPVCDRCSAPAVYLVSIAGTVSAYCAACTDWRPGDGRMEREAAARLGMQPHRWARENRHVLERMATSQRGLFEDDGDL